MHSQLESTEPHGASPARLLAVVALVGVAIVIIVIVAGSLGGSGDDNTTGASHGGKADSGKPSQDYYVLQSGDTLSTVARKFNIGVGKLQVLNPNLDPQALPPQGCVDLVKDGCKELSSGG